MTKIAKALIPVFLVTLISGPSFAKEFWNWSKKASHHQAVCHIVSKTNRASYHGSGVLVKYKGYVGVITAAHNARHNKMWAQFGNRQTVSADIQYTDKNGHDIAFLPTGEVSGIRPVSLGLQSDIRSTMEVVARKSDGVVRRFWVPGLYQNKYLLESTRAGVIHGDSGGGVFSRDKLVGVVFAAYDTTQVGQYYPNGQKSPMPIYRGVTATSVDTVRAFLDRTLPRSDMPLVAQIGCSGSFKVYGRNSCRGCLQFNSDYALNVRGLKKYLIARYGGISKHHTDGAAPVFVTPDDCVIRGYRGAEWLKGKIAECGRQERKPPDPGELDIPESEPSESGPKGDKGDRGPPGHRGERGQVGPKGDTGDRGPEGNPGERGPIGPKGDKGDTGEQGAKGDRGPIGLKGDQGDRGPEGSPGERGPEGPKGDAGISVKSLEIIDSELVVSFSDGSTQKIELPDVPEKELPVVTFKFMGKEGVHREVKVDLNEEDPSFEIPPVILDKTELDGTKWRQWKPLGEPLHIQLIEKEEGS